MPDRDLGGAPYTKSRQLKTYRPISFDFAHITAERTPT